LTEVLADFCDPYQKEVIEIAKRYGAGYSSLYAFEKALTWGTNLQEKAIAQGFVMMVRGNERFQSVMREFRDHHGTESLVIYSMWDGYLQQEGSVAKTMMEEFQNTIHLHTSGHATRQAIIDVWNTVPSNTWMMERCSTYLLLVETSLVAL